MGKPQRKDRLPQHLIDINISRKNEIRFTAVSRIKQLDFGMQNWWTFEERAALTALAFKVWKSLRNLRNSVVLSLKRISYFLHFYCCMWSLASPDFNSCNTSIFRITCPVLSSLLLSSWTPVRIIIYKPFLSNIRNLLYVHHKVLLTLEFCLELVPILSLGGVSTKSNQINH